MGGEYLYRIEDSVGNVYIAIPIDGDALGTRHGARAIAVLAEGAKKAALFRKYLYPEVHRIGDIYQAVPIDKNAHREIKLTGAAKGPDLPQEGESGTGRFSAGLKGVFFVLCVCLMLAGCAGTGMKELSGAHAAGSVYENVWPYPPEKARIAFIRTLEQPSDLGRGKGLLKGFLELILGPRQERVIKPFGIAVDSAGRVIVADTAFRKLHIFDIRKKKYRGMKLSGGNEFIYPLGVAVDINDNIYEAF